MYVLLGLGWRLELLYGVVRPGLDQPPLRCGDGDRDNDMSGMPGVPGTVGKCCPNRPPLVRPDVVAYVSDAGEWFGAIVRLGDAGAIDERRL